MAADGDTPKAADGDTPMAADGDTPMAADGDTPMAADGDTAMAADGDTAMAAAVDTAMAADGDTAIKIVGDKFSNLSGVFFGQFRKGEKLIKRHWLDTNIEKYYETFERILIPQCMDITPHIPSYSKRIQQFISYNCPALSDTWNFQVELIYRIVADKAHQTEDSITKMYLLRGVMDLLATMFTLLDDIADNSEHRMGKKSWHKVCEGGTSGAIYDSLQIGFLSFYLLKKNFKDAPGYCHMIEIVSTVFLKMNIGQTLDILGQGEASPSMNHYKKIACYKAGESFKLSSAIALIHAGVLSEEIINKTMEVFAAIGTIAQSWDDFVDFYCTCEQTGKPPCDFINGATTWASATAMENFNSSQAAEFKECYGSSDPAKINRVRQLYDEIDLPSLYVDHMVRSYNVICDLATSIPHEGVRKACFSYIEWLLGRDPKA